MRTDNDTYATFVCVRHGQTEWNAAGRWQGWLDSPLTLTGKAEAERAALELRATVFDAAYSSDSGRAIETADIILKPHPAVRLQRLGALRERDYGSYEGLSTEEIEERFPGTRYDEKRDTREDWRPPGGESLKQVQERLEPFIKEAASRHQGETVLIVTHSNVVRLLDSIASREPLSEIWHRAPGNACIFILSASPAGTLHVEKHFCVK